MMTVAVHRKVRVRASIVTLLLSSSSIFCAASPPPLQTVTLHACAGMSGVNETCTIVFNATACTTAKCSRLLVLFSGGEMGCVTGAGYSAVMANYSAHGWAAACINYFETSSGSGAVPYYMERDRLDASVAAVTAGQWATAYWTGEDLLLEGISHGASSPLIVMARFGVDAQPHWQGTRATGGCFFDGTVNQSASADLLKTGARGGRPCTFPVSYERMLERYCPANPSGCNLDTNENALLDLVADAPAANFSLKKWRMAECGSEMAPCTGDIIPMAPFQQLCAGIQKGPSHTCDWFRLPLDGHLTCHAHHAFECRMWFEGSMKS
jgi:hypothetical protein